MLYERFHHDTISVIEIKLAFLLTQTKCLSRGSHWACSRPESSSPMRQEGGEPCTTYHTLVAPLQIIDMDKLQNELKWMTRHDFPEVVIVEWPPVAQATPLSMFSCFIVSSKNMKL